MVFRTPKNGNKVNKNALAYFVFKGIGGFDSLHKWMSKSHGTFSLNAQTELSNYPLACIVNA